jgi:hypothetical protein
MLDDWIEERFAGGEWTLHRAEGKAAKKQRKR